MHEGILLSRRELRAKSVAIMKTKMQLMLGKKHLGKERIPENECLPNFEPK